MSRKPSDQRGAGFLGALKYPGSREETWVRSHGSVLRHTKATPVSVEEVRREVAKRRERLAPAVAPVLPETTVVARVHVTAEQMVMIGGDSEIFRAYVEAELARRTGNRVRRECRKAGVEPAQLNGSRPSAGERAAEPETPTPNRQYCVDTSLSPAA